MMMACSRVSSMSVRAVITDHSSGVQGSACGVVMVPGSKTPFVDARCLPVPGPVQKHRGEPVPVKRHRGEPGHTMDTQGTHGSHRRTSQPSLTTIPHNHPEFPTLQPAQTHTRTTAEARTARRARTADRTPGRTCVATNHRTPPGTEAHHSPDQERWW